MEINEKFGNVGNQPSCLKPNAWYSLTPEGDVLTARVGHTATFVPSEQLVIFIGGAVPDGLCDDTWVLYLADCTCAKSITQGNFEYRYEHIAFGVSPQTLNIGEKTGARIWVFAGADMEENKNDLWEFEVENLKWNRIVTQGISPSKRTLHASAGCVTKLTVFGGGCQGADAVPDTSVYQLDVSERTWCIVDTSGDPPTPRHGHVLASNQEGQVYIHGGLDGKLFHDNLYILDRKGIWTKPNVSERKPKGRASHGGVLHGNCLYILGGLTKDGVVNDFWRMDTRSFIWEEINVESQPIPARLDFAMIVIELPGKFLKQNCSSVRDLDEVNSVDEYLKQQNKPATIETRGLSPFIMVHGGMDDKGMIYQDFFVFKLSIEKKT